MAEKNVLIAVGTLRKNGFNEQLAQRIADSAHKLRQE